MQIYGHSVDDPDGEKPLTLERAFFAGDLRDVDMLIAFFEHVRRSLKPPIDTDGSHEHLRDWLPGWKQGDPDVIFVLASS